MTALDGLPQMDSFFGIDLKTGSSIISALGIVHPIGYCCTFCEPLSYLLVTMWILVALYFAASIILMFGIVKDDATLCSIWVWYALIFVVVMLLLLILLTFVNITKRRRQKVIFGILAMLWYILSIYFVFVVNSYRKKLS